MTNMRREGKPAEEPYEGFADDRSHLLQSKEDTALINLVIAATEKETFEEAHERVQGAREKIFEEIKRERRNLLKKIYPNRDYD